eukprot:GHVO01032282.1.p1 GENE.GHVO01032282.1~~GHVO01032282.1.p1  ORF type:complete len:194 (-),score=30.99 GHVO01032282.1:142-723(-)
MHRWQVYGKRIGVVGMGGLGHMAVKIGKAMGCHVVVISSSPIKEQAARKCGAKDFILHRNLEQETSFHGSLDFLIDTVSAQKSIDHLLTLLNLGGVYCLVGLPGTDHQSNGPPNRICQVDQMKLLFRRHVLTGSVVGGTKETAAMLAFCAEHGITADIEMCKMEDINTIWARLLRQDVRFRFVIDIKGSKMTA